MKHATANWIEENFYDRYGDTVNFLDWLAENFPEIMGEVEDAIWEFAERQATEDLADTADMLRKQKKESEPTKNQRMVKKMFGIGLKEGSHGAEL